MDILISFTTSVGVINASNIKKSIAVDIVNRSIVFYTKHFETDTGTPGSGDPVNSGGFPDFPCLLILVQSPSTVTSAPTKLYRNQFTPGIDRTAHLKVNGNTFYTYGALEGLANSTLDPWIHIQSFAPVWYVSRGGYQHGGYDTVGINSYRYNRFGIKTGDGTLIAVNNIFTGEGYGTTWSRFSPYHGGFGVADFTAIPIQTQNPQKFIRAFNTLRSSHNNDQILATLKPELRSNFDGVSGVERFLDPAYYVARIIPIVSF
jgi:hypothetical protein